MPQPISATAQLNSLTKTRSLVWVKLIPFHPNCSSISFSLVITELFLPEVLAELVGPDRGFGVYWGAAELDGGRCRRRFGAWLQVGGGPEGPEDTRPGTPELPRSSSITFFNHKDLFAGREEILDGHYFWRKYRQELDSLFKHLHHLPAA